MSTPEPTITTKKRYRRVNAKPGELVVAFGREDRWNRPDLLYAWGGEGAAKPDSRVVMTAIEEAKVFEGRSLREELALRGYDIESLRFTVRRSA